jgi:uncharacterized RDD family membrane protein YckC
MRSYTDELTPQPPVTTLIPSGAGFGIRLGARLLDLLLSVVLALIGGVIGGIALAIMEGLGHAPENWVQLVGQESYWTYVFGIFGSVLYGWFAEGLGGTTVGKLCCGLSVVQLDGTPCRFGAAGKRNLAYLMDALFFGLVGYESMKKTKLQQRHGDHWGKTVVVKKAVFTPTPKPAVWKIVLGILIGAAFWTACHIAQLFAAVFAY